jgi:hypothetical protein
MQHLIQLIARVTIKAICCIVMLLLYVWAPIGHLQGHHVKRNIIYDKCCP